MLFSELKKISMTEFLQDQGIPTKGNMINCLFHDDRSPSCKVYQDHIYCFACQKKYDVLDLYQQFTGKDIQTASDELARIYNLSFSGNDFKPKVVPKTDDQLEDVFAASVAKAYDKISRDMSGIACFEHVRILMKRLYDTLPSYVSTCTCEILLEHIQGQ